MAAVEMINVSKRFGTVEAVRDVSLRAEQGEFVSFLGPSGCGKSTLLNIVAGLEDPTAGRIEMDGTPVTHKTPKERGVAMVFQDYALYPHMTVRQNLAFPLGAQNSSPAEAGRVISETAERLNISNLLDRKPGALSGGQRQRVALGRALVRRPRVFLMDEPLSNLDAKLRVQMRVELKQLKESLNVTTIYVTHDQTEAMTLSDRIAVFDAGRLQQIDEPEAIYNRPRNLFVASFVGATPMNFVKGELLADGDGLAFWNEDLRLRLPEPPGAGEENLAGRRVVLGLRPEELRLADQVTANPETFDIQMCEYLGHESLMHLRRGGTNMVARIAADRAPKGSQALLSFSDCRFHFFDCETGDRLPIAGRSREPMRSKCASAS